jgi:hypothetical protein
MWSALPDNEFGRLKKNEYLIIGPVPADAVVSRITFDSLEAWNYLDLFPQLHAQEYRKVRDIRRDVSSGSVNFDVASGDTMLFLVAILGHQYGAFPNDSAIWQLLIHFTALANHHIDMKDTKTYEGQLEPRILGNLRKIARNIKTMQKQNKATSLSDDERLKSGFVDIEGAIKDWALINPCQSGEVRWSSSTTKLVFRADSMPV